MSALEPLAAPPERPTDDVDLIVELASASEFHKLGKALRALGFREDTSEGAPICRWVVAGVRVDVMPMRPTSARRSWMPSTIVGAVTSTTTISRTS